MIWTIARKEITANLLSYKFFIVILLSSVLQRRHGHENDG